MQRNIFLAFLVLHKYLMQGTMLLKSLFLFKKGIKIVGTILGEMDILITRIALKCKNIHNIVHKYGSNLPHLTEWI